MELVLKPSTIEPQLQDLAFMLDQGRQDLRRWEVIRAPWISARRAMAQLPLIFIVGAVAPLHTVFGRPANQALHVEEAVTDLVEKLDVRFEYRRVEFLQSGADEKAA